MDNVLAALQNPLAGAAQTDDVLIKLLELLRSGAAVPKNQVAEIRSLVQHAAATSPNPLAAELEKELLPLLRKQGSKRPRLDSPPPKLNLARPGRWLRRSRPGGSWSVAALAAVPSTSPPSNDASVAAAAAGSLTAPPSDDAGTTQVVLDLASDAWSPESRPNERAPKQGRSRKSTAKRLRRTWKIGSNLGGVIGRSGLGVLGIGKQCQVLLCNGYQRLRELDIQKQKELALLFPAVGSTESTTLASRILSGLLRVRARTIEEEVQWVRKHGMARRRGPGGRKGKSAAGIPHPVDAAAAQSCLDLAKEQLASAEAAVATSSGEGFLDLAVSVAAAEAAADVPKGFRICVREPLS